MKVTRFGAKPSEATGELVHRHDGIEQYLVFTPVNPRVRGMQVYRAKVSLCDSLNDSAIVVNGFLAEKRGDDTIYHQIEQVFHPL